MIDTFPAYLVRRLPNEPATASICRLHASQLPAGELLIQVDWSSLNYKDALATRGHPGVVRAFPHVPGIDAAGTVVSSDSAKFQVGQSVLVTGYEFGSGQWGGWSRFVRVPAEWAVPLPDGLSPFEAMSLGTAGFTAAMCAQQLQKNGIKPASGPILVSGATGGVGCLAVQLLSHLGYEVVASTTKTDAHDWLRQLGAKSVVDRIALGDDDRPLVTAKWAGAVDTVGGRTLAAILRETQPFGCVAACGLVGGTDLATTVHPFILRGVVLSGVSASLCRQPRRDEIWRHLAGPWRMAHLGDVVRKIDLSEIGQEVEKILNGQIQGRVVLSLGQDRGESGESVLRDRPG